MVGPANPFSQELHAVKYRQPGESFDDYCVRYSRTLADDERHFRRLLSATREQRLLPGGRQQLAVGNPFMTTAFSCFVGGMIADDMQAIMAELGDSAMTLRTGGGCGWDFSTLRPAGDPVRRLGPGAAASGPVTMMAMWNAMCGTIRSAGMRRGAMMGVLRVDHPDILRFIRSKRDEKSLTNFNVSVAVTDDFMEALEADGLYDLTFGGNVYSRVRAADVWAAVMENNWDWAEPGVLFIDVINRMNPLRYLEWIAATNPCVTGDTEVLTGRGYRRIESLVGEAVEVWNGECWSLVEPRVTGRDQPLVEVELSNGVCIRCTPYHTFHLEDGGECQAEKLGEGTALVTFRMPLIEGGKDVAGAYAQGVFSGDGSWKRGRAEVWLYGEKKRLLPFLPAGHVNEYQSAGSQTRLQVSLEGEFLPKDFVPGCDWSVSSRLAWLAGLADTDGTAVRSRDRGGEVSSVGLHISSVDRPFLLRVRKMLTTVGIDPVVALMREGGERVMPDGRGGEAEYPCQDCWRLQINAWDLARLQELGFRTNRLRLEGNTPDRSARRKLRVMAVRPAGTAEKVYCFTEPLAHRGTFEGVVTGQCAEQPLPPHGACLLGSLNLVKYLVPSYLRGVRGHDGAREAAPRRSRWDLDRDLFADDVRTAVRAFDNVIENTTFPLEAQKQEALLKRRMGLGVTGVANALEILGHPYGSPGYLTAQDAVLELLRDVAYETSCDLALEKGPFPAFDADGWLASGYARTLPEPLRDRIARDGLRNGLLLSLAPTGTISWAADNVSSGVEPPPVLEGMRTVQLEGGPTTVEVNDYALAFHGVRCLTGPEVPPAAHVAVLCAAQRYVDSAVSKTINLAGCPAGESGPGLTTFEEFKGIYRDVYAGGGKGCTTFNANGKRRGIIAERPRRPEPAAGRAAVAWCLAEATAARRAGEDPVAALERMAAALDGGDEYTVEVVPLPPGGGGNAACSFDGDGRRTCGE